MAGRARLIRKPVGVERQFELPRIFRNVNATRLSRYWEHYRDMVHTRPGTWLTLSESPFGVMAMPWLEINLIFERHHFAQDLASGLWTMTELCTRYGISRNTGYTWRERFTS